MGLQNGIHGNDETRQDGRGLPSIAAALLCGIATVAGCSNDVQTSTANLSPDLQHMAVRTNNVRHTPAKTKLQEFNALKKIRGTFFMPEVETLGVYWFKYYHRERIAGVYPRGIILKELKELRAATALTDLEYTVHNGLDLTFPYPTARQLKNIAIFIKDAAGYGFRIHLGIGSPYIHNLAEYNAMNACEKSRLVYDKDRNTQLGLECGLTEQEREELEKIPANRLVDGLAAPVDAVAANNAYFQRILDGLYQELGPTYRESFVFVLQGGHPTFTINGNGELKAAAPERDGSNGKPLSHYKQKKRYIVKSLQYLAKNSPFKVAANFHTSRGGLFNDPTIVEPDDFGLVYNVFVREDVIDGELLRLNAGLLDYMQFNVSVKSLPTIDLLFSYVGEENKHKVIFNDFQAREAFLMGNACSHPTVNWCRTEKEIFEEIIGAAKALGIGGYWNWAHRDVPDRHWFGIRRAAGIVYPGDNGWKQNLLQIIKQDAKPIISNAGVGGEIYLWVQGQNFTQEVKIDLFKGNDQHLGTLDNTKMKFRAAGKKRTIQGIVVPLNANAITYVNGGGHLKIRIHDSSRGPKLISKTFTIPTN